MKKATKRTLAVILVLAVAAVACFVIFSESFGYYRFIAADYIKGLFDGAKTETVDTKTVAVDSETLLGDLRTKISDSLLLVNSEYGLPDSFDEGHVIEYSEGVYLHREMTEAFRNLSKEISDRFGQKLFVMSSFRSAQSQAVIADQRGDWAAEEGHSEHQTGLAADIYVKYYAGAGFLKSKAGQWVNSEADSFGFIIRYPYYGKSSTGFSYEPWHIRFVGLPHSEIIHGNRITLEKYIFSLKPGNFYRYGKYIISRQPLADEYSVPEQYMSLTFSPDNTGNVILTFEMQ